MPIEITPPENDPEITLPVGDSLNDAEVILPTTKIIEVVGRGGKMGDTGAKGAAGEKGEKGEKGEPGIGIPGTPGKDADLDVVNDLIDEKTEDIKDTVEKIASDSFVTPSEKRTLQLEIDRIIAERPQIERLGQLHQLITPLNNYIDAFDALMIYIQPILADTDVTTEIVYTTFKNKFGDFYDARAILLKLIADSDYDNTEQALATLEGVEKITNFWKITLDDESGIIAAGTMLVGTPNYNNAGMTGVTDQGDESVRFFAGAPYQNKNIAPWRILNDGRQWSGTAQSGWDWGITNPNIFTIRGGLAVDAGGNVSEIDVFRGAYSPSATYYKGNTVTSGGSLWRYKHDIPGNGGVPAENASWTIAVKKGDPGAPGTPGSPGADGQEGIGVEYRYMVTGSWSTPPAAPTPGDPAPSGWTITPPAFTVGQYLWKISARKTASGAMVGTWAGPFRDTGVPGERGEKGEQGNQGIPGTPGDDGTILYTWIKYANTPTTGMSDLPAGKSYIGIAYNKPAGTASTNYSDYTWSEWKGPQGVPGQSAVTYYTWLKYADTPTTGMSDLPTGKKYMGLAYNKSTQTESSVYSDYQWSLIVGEGVQGPPGQDGTPLFTWVKYADGPSGQGISDSPTGKAYIGFAFNKTTAAESSTPGDYQWSLIKGEQGSQGNQGIPGATNYTWIKYADSPLGSGMSDDPAGKTYIGLAFNKTTATESTTASDYMWSLMQGAQGPKGPYIIDMGIWNDTMVYQGTASMLQMVQYGTTGYLTRSDAGNIPAGTLPTSTAHWEVFQANFESIYTKILVAVTANISNLVVGQLMSNNGLISLNLNDDNSLQIRHNNEEKSKGIVIGTDLNTGQPIAEFYTDTGELVWSLGESGEIIKYITVIPEKWTENKLVSLGDHLATDAQLKTSIELKLNQISGSLWHLGAPAAAEVSHYVYYAGDNPESDTNEQYNGWHTTQFKLNDNWIVPGYYAPPGRVLAEVLDAYKGRVRVYQATLDLETPGRVIYGDYKWIQVDLPVT